MKMKILKQGNIPERETKPSVASPSKKYKDSIANAMLEKDLQQYTFNMAACLGYKHYHTHNSFRSDPGFPDSVLLNPQNKRLIFCEFKRQKKDPTPTQQWWIDSLQACGQEVYVIRPMDWLDGTVEKILRGK